MRDLLLGIDLGTTAAKAALFALDGRLESVGQAEYPLHHVRPNWIEQSPEAWWQAVCAAIQTALKQVAHSAERVIGVAVSSQAPTLLPLDRHGNPLRHALIWMDRRADGEVERLRESVGEDDIYRITGNRADSFFLAPKLLWFKDHEPELFAQTHQLVQANGYIAYRLSRSYSIDPAHSALTGLRDHRVGDWSTALLERCGIEPSQFPPIRAGHEMIGEVTADAARETGLRAGTPVMAGSIDGAAAALEAGAVQAGVAAEMTGTSTVVMMPNEAGLTHPDLISVPHAVPGVHLLIGATVASGASLRWFRDQFGMVEVQAGALLGVDPFDLLTQQAERIAPGSGVIFLPYMMGERSPLWHTEARGVFFGLSLATPRAALIRAILEGTGFALRHNIETARGAGCTVEEIRSVGGGAKSALWCQIKADILGIPVTRPETSVGAPFGDALLVGYGAGLYSDLADIVREAVRVERVFEPDMERHQRYGEIYQLFRDLYTHLRDDFTRAAALFSSGG